MAVLLKQKPFLDAKVYCAYVEYKREKKIAKTIKVNGRENLRAIIRCILKHISYQLVERTGGVFIKNLGYFFVWKVPRKIPYSKFTRGGKAEEKLNFKTDGHMYSPIFLSSGGQPTLEGWIMDNKFSEDVKDGIKAKIDSGFQYKMYPNSLLKLLRRRI